MSNILDEIKESSVDNKLVVCFSGVGSAFAKTHANTSLILAKNGKTILVDCGKNLPDYLYNKGISVTDFDAYHFTHSHSDHIGGVEELFFISRYVRNKKVDVIITESYQHILWEESLKGGCEHSETGLLKFTDFANILRPEWVKSKPREMYNIDLFGINLKIFRTAHYPGNVNTWECAFWSTGLIIDDKVMYTCDTRFDSDLFNDFPVNDYEIIFHDCQLYEPGAVHATYNELKNLPNNIKSKMSLVHYGDNFDKFNPKDDGFIGFTNEWNLYTF